MNSVSISAAIFACIVVFPTASGLAQETTTILASRSSTAPSVEEFPFRVPPFSVEHQVRLILEARIDSPRLAGSNPWIRVAVNGNYVTPDDLLNKRNEFKLLGGLDLTWFRSSRWRVLYSPDFKAAIEQTNSRYACPEDDPYRFVWDITRHVRPGDGNTLRIHHLQVLAKPSTLVLRNVRVEAGHPVSPPEPDRVEPAPTGPLPTFVAKGSQKVPMEVVLGHAGMIELDVAGHRFPITTRTSLPEGQWWETRQSANAAVVPAGQTATVSWTTGSYNVKRTVGVRDDHVHVADTIANRGAALVGVMVEHRLGFDVKPIGVLVAGRQAYGESAASRNPYHPSAFARWNDVGLGMVAEDDVFRVHVKSFSQPDHLGLADDMLGIEPGESVTLEWSVYPVPDGDYWDFINAVRRNWGSNFRIPGPFAFSSHLPGGKPAEWYGGWVRARDLNIVCGGIAKYPNGKYAHGTGILHAPKWVESEAEWIRGILATAPDVKALAYFHAQCCTEPEGETKYADSRLIDSKGEHLGYPYHYRLPLYLPTRENGYGRALWGFVRTCLEDIGTSGLYWDEMSHSVLWLAHDAPWDGVTALIDPRTHAVTGKRSSVPLLMQPLKEDIVRHVRERGKFMMANTQPATRTMLRHKIVRFVETGTYSHLANTHLGCPIGLGNHHAETTHADSTRNVRRTLQHGAVYYGHYYDREPAPWNFTEVMFPITPVELCEGMVLGQERIHTAKSGRFGWPDGSVADIYVIDSQGVRVEDPDVTESVENGSRMYEIRMPGDHIAVLVRQDSR